MDALTKQLCMNQLTQKNPEANEVTPMHQRTEKIFTLKWVGKAETHSCHKPYYWHSVLKLGGNSQLPASSEEGRLFLTYLISQLLQLPPKRPAPKSHSSQSQKGLVFINLPGPQKTKK